MKSSIIFILLTIRICTPSPLAAEDIRIVSGRSVDLQPVWDWLNSKQGERPLKHWKAFTILEIKGQVDSYDRCVVTSEDGSSKQILLAHCDQRVRNPIVALSETQSRIGTLTASLNYQIPRTTIYSPGVEGQLRGFKVNHDAKIYAELDTLNDRLPELKAAARKAETTPVLAMFTWQIRDGVEVWESGWKK